MTSRSNKTRTTLSAALAYAERGWPVFPLLPRDKRPLPGTEGFKDASTDRSVILQWWQLFPEANVGLATGFAFDVLDIDGPSAVPALQELLGPEYRHTGPVASTGKGKHLYFRPTTGARNRAGLLGGKVDFRGTGGYVVAPPSIHPSGRVYSWDDNRDERQELPVVPENLREVILPARKPLSIKTAAIREGGLSSQVKILSMTKKGAVIIERPDIYEVCALLGLTVIPKGNLYVTNCIFHPDPGPSLTLYPDNTFHCYGCEAHGDSKDLIAGQDMTGRKAI